MSTTFPTPPTFASPVVVNPQTGENQFNPIWLQWFLVLAQFLTSSTVGRIRDFVPVTSSGTYVPSNGTNNILALLWGGGAPGGSAAITSTGQVSVGGGGGAGGFAWALMTTGFSGQVLTLGGPAQPTTFVGLTAQAGLAGTAGTALTGPGFVLGGAGGGSSGGAQEGYGLTGETGVVLSTTVALSGAGAGSSWGLGGTPRTTSGPGNSATGRVAGGSGALNYASQSSVQAGGSGGGGFAVILELS